jgi:hypothetical protein
MIEPSPIVIGTPIFESPLLLKQPVNVNPARKHAQT